jgi:predicted secreted protein
MENNLRAYAQSGITIKRFTFYRNGNLLQSKPKDNQKYVIVEDFLGDRSLLWIACIESGKEIWRHSMNDVVRLTYDEPIAYI